MNSSCASATPEGEGAYALTEVMRILYNMVSRVSEKPSVELRAGDRSNTYYEHAHAHVGLEWLRTREVIEVISYKSGCAVVSRVFPQAFYCTGEASAVEAEGVSNTVACSRTSLLFMNKFESLSFTYAMKAPCSVTPTYHICEENVSAYTRNQLLHEILDTRQLVSCPRVGSGLKKRSCESM